MKNTKAKKYLGQHFLKNKGVLTKIIAAAKLSKKDTVLEIGPGHGELTELMAQKAGKVIAVEKDPELTQFLISKFEKYRNVEIIQGDILKTKTTNYKPQTKNLPSRQAGYKVVANLPYYITSRFLRLFLSEKASGRAFSNRTKLMVLMVQKEVAERIMAIDGKESLLSLSVKAYAKPEIVIKKVPAAYFSPSPKVDSAVIKITPYKGGVERSKEVEKILSIARLAFQQKRKMLRRSIGNLIEVGLHSKYANKRPEELSLKDWQVIVRNHKYRQPNPKYMCCFRKRRNN